MNLLFLLRPTDICDYLVMSTHKWMGNVKTAGLVVYADGVAPPLPHAVSFGYDGAMLRDGETAVQVSTNSHELVWEELYNLTLYNMVVHSWSDSRLG